MDRKRGWIAYAYAYGACIYLRIAPAGSPYFSARRRCLHWPSAARRTREAKLITPFSDLTGLRPTPAERKKKKKRKRTERKRGGGREREGGGRRREKEGRSRTAVRYDFIRFYCGFTVCQGARPDTLGRVSGLAPIIGRKSDV